MGQLVTHEIYHEAGALCSVCEAGARLARLESALRAATESLIDAPALPGEPESNGHAPKNHKTCRACGVAKRRGDFPLCHSKLGNRFHLKTCRECVTQSRILGGKARWQKARNGQATV